MKRIFFALMMIGVAAAMGCRNEKTAEYDGSELWLPAGEGHASVVIPEGMTPTLAICVRELQNYGNGDTVTLTRVDEAEASGLCRTGEGFAGGGNAEAGRIGGGNEAGNAVTGRVDEGKGDWYRIEHEGEKACRISSATDLGLLYGTYALLRQERIGEKESLVSAPAIGRRILNHWDNLDGTIERGYAGRSLWQWDSLPHAISPRYEQYARACASVGINGTVLNNVNASAKILSKEYLEKAAALADVFRPYGLRVYLSVNFASPIQLDSMETADPLRGEVREWWKAKADEIYGMIPDFGGFLVKANSEGQPGPCDYGRSHAEGANMLAEALEEHGGIVMWRAFVYSPNDADRAKQAYNEFQPLDGEFAENVIVQIKNGPIDFQPREPISPLLMAMPKTKKMAEFQITQEYLGHSNHLAYLAPMWKETFDIMGADGMEAVAGVANIGDDANWTGHPMAQANWYAFGRLAWNPGLTSEEIAHEWASQWGAVEDATALPEIEGMMLRSREAVVDYMMPMGLHHIFAFGHHYGPEPWCDVEGARADWLPKYYHQADGAGIGFDRSAEGSNAAGQYPEELGRIYGDADSCPEELLLWFHHLAWEKRLASGKTLWEALCSHYDRGVREAEAMSATWDGLEGKISTRVWADVHERLEAQKRDAHWWHDGCLLYFQELNGLPLPGGTIQPVFNLDSLKGVSLGISNYEAPSAELLREKLKR
ncbi:MAG: alpha-glucuronidase [Clostridium sp.]|nr:alpha-glucuronidase [Clostridium sp.]